MALWLYQSWNGYNEILPVLSGQHDIIQSVGLKGLIAVAGNDPPGSGTVDCLEALCEDIMTVIW